MSFKKKIYTNLSRYRENELKILEMGTWREKPYGHILPKEKRQYNILDEYRDSFFSSELGKMKFHRYFHHLNSSQAMCINYFYPIIKEKKLHLITKYIGFQDEKIDYRSVQFEKESTVDCIGNRRPTNFDFYFKTESGKEIFFEVKYTEYDFGKATNDSEHCDKYKNVYSKHLAKVIQQEYTKKEEFFKYYQIIRNLIHIDKNSYVILLYPEENHRVSQSALFAKKDIVKQEFSSHLFNKTWEDIISYVTDNDKVSLKILTEFKKKYLL